jgi:hypothetical protein
MSMEILLFAPGAMPAQCRCARRSAPACVHTVRCNLNCELNMFHYCITAVMHVINPEDLRHEMQLAHSSPRTRCSSHASHGRHTPHKHVRAYGWLAYQMLCTCEVLCV